MARLYSESAFFSFPGNFHDISSFYLFLQIRISRISEPGFQRLHFFIFQLLGPLCIQRIKKMAVSSRIKSQILWRNFISKPNPNPRYKVSIISQSLQCNDVKHGGRVFATVKYKLTKNGRQAE